MAGIQVASLFSSSYSRELRKMVKVNFCNFAFEAKGKGSFDLMTNKKQM